MMRPPLISTDIAGLPSLLAAGRDLDVGFLPLLAVDVDTLLLQLGNRRLGQVSAVRAVARGLLDRAELLGDLRGACVCSLVHDPDAELVRPDERVDLVHLPPLVAA